MLSTREQNTLVYFKERGHVLLDEYITYDMRTKKRYEKRSNAYAVLATKMCTDIASAHFTNMTTIDEVQYAIKCIEQMIVDIKQANDDRLKYACAPREVVQAELTKIKESRIPTFTPIQQSMKQRLSKREADPMVALRNEKIVKDYLAGRPIDEICAEYYVSEHTVNTVTRTARQNRVQVKETVQTVVEKLIEKKQSDYTIVKSTTLSNLMNTVNTSLAAGYTAIGGVFQFSEKDIVHSGVINYYFAQTLVK